MSVVVTPRKLSPKAQARLDGWRTAVDQLLDQVQGWCAAAGWAADRVATEIAEPEFGTYTLPTLHVRVADRARFTVTPIASTVIGPPGGRVDVEGWPSLNRVRLVPVDGGWQFITDSNVRIRKPWDRNTFVEVVSDLVSPS